MLFHWVDGRLRLPAAVHPFPDLLDLSAEQVLAAFRRSQAEDFVRLLGPETPLPPELRTAAPEALRALFEDLHEHVMSHPVWRHPFFLRFFEGRFSLDQARAFALSYFNQIKNTRQCVALAVGRFHGLLAMTDGRRDERLSELTQILLAQLVADEYGVGSHALEDYPPLDRLLRTRTHIGLYRQLFEALEIPPEAQDVPLLPAVADNVLTQRLLAGSDAFTPLESLASVGLGMEWGVPEFFSLLLGGLLRYAQQHQAPFTAHHLEVFIAHVRYDVLHAVAVMLATALHMADDADLLTVKDACNTLMASRYGMMSGLYAHVFGEPCPGPAEIGLAPRYHLRDRRIAEALSQARRTVPPGRLAAGTAWGDLPFVFADERI